MESLHRTEARARGYRITEINVQSEQGVLAAVVLSCALAVGLMRFSFAHQEAEHAAQDAQLRAAEEAADLDRSIAAIKQATGIAPQGFFCRGSESSWTRELLLQRGFLYTSNAFDDDLPYYDRSLSAGALLVLPYSLDSNDMKFFHPNGFVRARDMVDYVSDALQVLEAEAARGLPRLLNVGFHLRIVGRPGRFAAFRDILRLLASKREQLWIAPRAAIARAFIDAVPATGVLR